MHRSFLILLSFLCFFVNLCLSDPRATQAALICTNRTAKVPERQTFVANFLATLDAVTPLIMRQKYAAVINGTGSTTVYAFGECMKDLDGTDCNLCFAQCKTQVLRCLPFQRAIRGGRLFYDGCYLRYDDYDFFNETLSAQDKTICATGDFSGGNKTVFSANVLDLVKNLSVQAPKNDGFFVGSVDRGNVSVFGLAQCWEFVNGSACETCLTNAASKIGMCAPKDEGRVLNAGCYLRYSTQKFYDNSTIPSRRNKRHGRLTVILAVTLPIVAVASIVATAVFFAQRRVVEKKRARKELGALLVTVNKSKLNFSYESLEKATNYFNPSNKLGQGGSGSVYKVKSCISFCSFCR
ncbi:PROMASTIGOTE SURFACE ANTIGEN PROTEIN PSA [Salix koriyanagi]|uniref:PROMASTIGOTE SURFACE ANTIGEN PROTEIN PSA n=1 Tax=Salix koriyanagi TaxID=2511006 RepID=A0A9Q0WSC2_9ROSI|nr:PROMASTIGOTE SURFACE ANTIGEN PROTEIN PSA [Salix koriyanagi]